MRKLQWLAIVLLVASSAFANKVAFVHANVVPMDSERVIPDQTVIIDNGKIVKVGPAATTRVPRGALRVDATGR